MLIEKNVFPNSKGLTVTEKNLLIPHLAYLITILEPYYFGESVRRRIECMCAEHFRRHCANSPGGVWKACFLNLIANYISASALLSTTQLPSQNNHRLKLNV